MTAQRPGLSEPAPSFTDRWQRTPRRWRVVLVLLGALVVGELASSLAGSLGGSGSGGATGPSSSYDSSGEGTEAFAQLLSLRGRDVDRMTTPLDATALPDAVTLFVLDPTSWNHSDTAAIVRVLQRGGRVVLGGRPPGHGVLRALLGSSTVPAWQATSTGTARRVAGAVMLRGVSAVVVDGAGSYRPITGPDSGVRPLLVGTGGVLALEAGHNGSLVLLGSSSPLANGSLGRADNAALALDLAGPGSDPVAFDEYDHGFGRPGTGVAGLPARWRFGLGIALIAVVVWVLSASRRFGPPALQKRPMIPARVEYVDAMATMLSTRPAGELGGLLAPMVEETRRHAGATAWRGAQGPADALEVPPRTDDQIVMVGRAMASVRREAP